MIKDEKTYSQLVEEIYHLTFGIGIDIDKIGCKINCGTTTNKTRESYEKRRDLSPNACIFYLLEEIQYQLRQISRNTNDIKNKVG